MKTFIENLGKGAATSIGGMVGTGLSRLFGLSWSPEKTMKEQMKYNKEIMALQNQYNQQAAAQGQQYAKDYWDYTSAENQVAHLKNAGLNIGLMYGQSGAGGIGASGGAKQEGVDQAQGNPVGMALQAQQIEQQRRATDAQIQLAEAQAEKAKEEAKKIGGIDTQEAIQRIQESLSRIELNNKKGDVFKADYELKMQLKELNKELTNKAFWDGLQSQEGVKEVQALATKYAMEARETYYKMKQAKIDADFALETYADRVTQVGLINLQITAHTKLANAQAMLPEAQINEIEASINELNKRAFKHETDAESYKKEVEAIIKRVNDQNVNEKWHLTNESISMMVDAFVDAALPFLNPSKAITRTTSTRTGKTVNTTSTTTKYGK